MERNILFALLAGVAIGATSAYALAPSQAQPTSKAHAAWTTEHAAIVAEAEPREPAPTF